MSRRMTTSIRRVAAVAIMVTMALASIGQAAHAQENVGAVPAPIPLSDVLAAPADYDLQVITIEGELVGDYGFRRDGFMWTQINDDTYARAAIVDGGARSGANVGVGMRLPSELGRGLDPVGGYRLEGPVVRATGVWRYHDPARSGESFLDVSSLDVVDSGRRLEEGPDWEVFTAGLVLLAVAGLMWIRRSMSGE
jgi:hypothetical protein